MYFECCIKHLPETAQLSGKSLCRILSYLCSGLSMIVCRFLFAVFSVLFRYTSFEYHLGLSTIVCLFVHFLFAIFSVLFRLNVSEYHPDISKRFCLCTMIFKWHALIQSNFMYLLLRSHCMNF